MFGLPWNHRVSPATYSPQKHTWTPSSSFTSTRGSIGFHTRRNFTDTSKEVYLRNHGMYQPSPSQDPELTEAEATLRQTLRFSQTWHGPPRTPQAKKRGVGLIHSNTAPSRSSHRPSSAALAARRNRSVYYIRPSEKKGLLEPVRGSSALRRSAAAPKN